MPAKKKPGDSFRLPHRRHEYFNFFVPQPLGVVPMCESGRNILAKHKKNKLKNLNFYELHNSYYYLWRIEKHLNPAFSLEDPTIEHILPQEMHTTANPKKGVSNQDDYNWEKDLNSEADYTWRTYLNVLGNLTILPRSENSKMGDLRFKKKQDYLSKSSDGLNYGYNYTSIRISQGLKNYSVWNEKSILDRSDKMVDYICEIWPH